MEKNQTDLRPFIQLEFGDPTTPKSILKYLEVALRRRLIALNMSKGSPLFFKKTAFIRHASIGRWLEPFLPAITSCSGQETRYIEDWLMQQLKTQVRSNRLYKF